MMVHLTHRKAILPIEMAMNASDDDDIEEESPNQQVVYRMQELKREIYKKAQKNIKASQMRMKEDYDKKHCSMRVRVYNYRDIILCKTVLFV